ncbi:hypothetical protein NAEGRDRAFT_80155 [Naegleria gruberi]|uniref:Uncharacterized protein n=1 Tax=Naegleria gruberi TaxID=5762 RepID=D2VJ44_NAEGR|nr:uncharacterized protein NAEGRDRAFT_80155 [Naegleria gruberi]EFC43134.1 hypothetical protein NAEGRDRAFT_80155 [Naegleria gruberi]|eukprot:XP_002675878.1 hypothetical protein NAEGRDRAFT_80155 [Naegleria gruberi strain NEG-M]
MFNNPNASHFLGASGRRGSTSSTASSTSSSPFFPTSILQNNAFNLNQQINNVKGTPPILSTGYYFQQYQKQIEQNKSLRNTFNSPSIQRQSPQELATTLYRTSTVTGKQPTLDFVMNRQEEEGNNSSMNSVKKNNASTSSFSTDLHNSMQSMNSHQQDSSSSSTTSILTTANNNNIMTNNNTSYPVNFITQNQSQPYQRVQLENTLGENYSSTNSSSATRKQSAGIVPSSPKEANKQFLSQRNNMSVSTASSNNNMLMNPSSASPTKQSPHLTSSLKTNVGFTSMQPPSSSSSTIPSSNRKLDIPTTSNNDNSTNSSSQQHNPIPTTSSSNPTSSPKIPALESEPPTVKLPSIYAVLLNDKDPYFSQGKDQNSEIIYLRPIAKMVENSKKKQSCHAQFGNNIVKKQSSLRSKIRGIVGSRRMEEFKKQTTSERAQSKTSSSAEESDKKDQSSENNLTVDVKTSSSDFNLDMNDDNIMAFGSSEDFGLMYDDMMGLDDQDFMSTLMSDDNLGLLSEQPNSNVSTPLLDRDSMRRSGSAMKHEVSHTSLSSFLSSPATPMASLPVNPSQTKEGQMVSNQSNFWDSSMSGSLDNIPVSSGNFFIPSAAKNSSSSNSMNVSNNNISSSMTTPNEMVRKQEVSTSNNMAPSRGVNSQNPVPSNQMSKPASNNSMMNNFNTSNNMNNTMNNNLNMNTINNNMNSLMNNMNNSMNSNSMMGNNKSMNNNMNSNMTNNNNMSTMNNNNNQHMGLNQQMAGMQNNMFANNNGMNNSVQNDSTSNFDTNNFFNISTDTLLQGILYAQKSGINLASLFALTLQQQQNQASSYNESTSNFGNSFKNNNQFNNMNNGNMFNNNVFSNMGSEMFPNQNQISPFPNNQQHNQFQKNQDNTSQLLLQKLLDSNNQQLNSNVQNSFSSRQQHQNDNMFNMNSNNNLSSQIDSLMMNKNNNNMLNMTNNSQMLYNQLNNQQQVKFNQISSPQNQQLNSPRQNNNQHNPLMNPSNHNNINRFVKTESDLNLSMNSQPNWKESYEEPEVVSLSTPRAVGSKSETKRIKIKQDTISSPPQQQHQHTSPSHDAGNDSSHDEDDESVSSNPQSPDKSGKKKRKSHVTASQVGIVELENNEGFECSYCLRKFKRKSDIKVHIRRHTGERPYICEIDGCGKAFTTASNLRRHNRNVHTKESMSSKYFPPHTYWDGRCFPSHITSFGTNNSSSANYSSSFDENNGDELDVKTYIESQQDDQPIGYTPMGSAAWDEGWQDFDNDSSPSSPQPITKSSSTVKQFFDDNFVSLEGDDNTDQSAAAIDQSEKNSSIKPNEKSNSFDMVVLLQKFSYYYLSIVNNDNCGDRFENVEESDVFMIRLPSETIRASKKLLISESNFFKLMIESQMKEANENQVDFSALSNEEELDTLKILNFLRYGNIGVPIKGTAFPLNLEDFGSNLIGIVDLLRLLDVADKFGVASFIVSVTSILNQYNVMILLEKALQITPELGSILIEACISVISHNLPCVLGGLIYEGVIDQFLERIPTSIDEWNKKCKETYKIFKQIQMFNIKTDTKLFMLQSLKTNPTVNYLVDVLPCDIFLRVMKCTNQLCVDDFLGLITLWILSSSFETCFQDYSTLENLETDNLIYRLREGIILALENVNMMKMTHNRSLFMLLHPIMRYYSRSYPLEFQDLFSTFLVETADPKNSIGDYTSLHMLATQTIAPMLKKCFGDHPILPKKDIAELYYQFCFDSTDNSYTTDNAQRIIPQLFAKIIKEQENDEIINEFSKLLTYVMFHQFGKFVEQVPKPALPIEKYKIIGQKNSLKSFEANLFGLDASGKTLLLERMKSPNSNEVVQTFQTIGFNNETISYGGAPINVVSRF